MISKEIYITREIEEFIKIQSQYYPILSVMGPRQSGKTKLIQKYFPHLPYYDLEEEDNFRMISKDPNRFVRDKCINGVIFDEFHYIPELTQILKTVSNELLRKANSQGKTAIPTRFVLTGSHNYLFDTKIRETMVGRAALIKLLPLTLQESGCKDAYDAMYKGGYPNTACERPNANGRGKRKGSEFHGPGSVVFKIGKTQTYCKIFIDKISYS